MKIYTRKGDGGETSFVDGQRVAKAALRVEAYGEVDELNASIGVARAEGTDQDMERVLLELQRDLFCVGAILADPKDRMKNEKASLGPEDVERLERHIDRLVSPLPALKHFVLPGGSKAGALLHQARAMCRRAERKIVALSRNEPVPPAVVAYMNRLSDLLFVMARREDRRRNKEETLW